MANMHDQVRRIVEGKAHNFGYSIRTLKDNGNIAEMLRQSDAWDRYKTSLPRHLELEAERAFARGYGLQT